MQEKQGINIVFLITQLFTGTLIALIAIYFIPEYYFILGTILLINTTFCGTMIWLQKKGNNVNLTKERARAELAENYIKEIQLYSTQQEKDNATLKESKEKHAI